MLLETLPSQALNIDQIMNDNIRKINKIVDQHMKNFITKITEKVGIDKITHFFAGATIALSVTLILCFVRSISNVIPYSIIEEKVEVICNIVK